MITPRELRLRGACRDLDSEMFMGDDEMLHQLGKKICEKCDVRVECLERALVVKESWGVWGGTTHHERKQLLKQKHRVKCPGCRSTEVTSLRHSEVCRTCGLTWLV